VVIALLIDLIQLQGVIKTNCMNTGKALLGVLAGLATGVAIGMLFAPDKGASTRKDISEKGEDLADALNEKIDEKFDDLIGAITGKVKKPTVKNQGAGVNQSEMVG
jgi:gas vesicle protein